MGERNRTSAQRHDHRAGLCVTYELKLKTVSEAQRHLTSRVKLGLLCMAFGNSTVCKCN